MNTLSPETATDLLAVVDRVEGTTPFAALVIGSAKKDNFVAGADIRWLRSLDDVDTALELIREAHEVFARLENLHSPEASRWWLPSTVPASAVASSWRWRVAYGSRPTTRPRPSSANPR